MNQPRLPFGTHRLARRHDVQTSKAAAIAALGIRSEHGRRIVQTLEDAGRPLAAEEIADLSGLSAVQVNRRLCELAETGRIRRSGELHRTRSGRHSCRWEVA